MKKFTVLFIGLFLLSHLSTAQQNIVVVNDKPVFVGATEKIRICPPKVRYESIATEEELNPSRFEAEDIAWLLAEKGKANLTEKGFTATENENIIPVKYNDFFKDPLPESVKTWLTAFSNDSSTAQLNVLVLDMKVKVGEEGSWNPTNGAITKKNHLTRIKAILINPQSQKVLWKNEVQLRNIATPKNPDFFKAIETLFNNLKNQQK